MANPLHGVEPSAWGSPALYQLALDSMSDAIFVKDLQHRWVTFNASFCRLLGRSKEELVGKSDPDLFPPEQAKVFWRLDDELFASGEPNDNEELVTHASGSVHTIWTRKYAIKNDRGEVIGLCGIISDLTDTAIQSRLLRAERAARESAEQRNLLAGQAELLDALALPVVEVHRGVLLVPIVGELSERRAARALAVLLERISATGASHALIDLTGVPRLDIQVASCLGRMLRAASLIGCRASLCGISPELARTLAALNLGAMETYGRLQDALARVIAPRAPG